MMGFCQWDKIASTMNKEQVECQDIYAFLMNCANLLLQEKRDEKSSDSDDESPMARANDIMQNKPMKDKKRKRHRRKASQIERMYKCQEKHCNRSYGTEGALKMHIKIKHPQINYDAKYSKGKLIKKPGDCDNGPAEPKQHQTKTVLMEDKELVESSLILTNLSHTIEAQHPMLVSPSPISYNSFVTKMEMSPSQNDLINFSLKKNLMSLNNLINTH